MWLPTYWSSGKPSGGFPGTCSGSYAPGTVVTLTATPASGSMLSGWGGACSGTAVCKLTLNGDASVKATFTAIPKPPPPPAVKCVVPKLKGDSLAKAKKALANAHCAVGKITQPKVKKGHKAGKLVVGSTKPGTGAKLTAGSKVAIKLVAAPKPSKKR